MTFSGHIAVAAITLRYFDDPVVLVAANLAAHPLLDAIPHAEWSTFRDSKWKMALITLADAVVGVGLIMLTLVYLNRAIWLALLVFLAALFVDLLDAIIGKYWQRFRYYHQYSHTWPQKPIEPVDWSKTVTGRTPTWTKLLLQTLIVIVAVFIIVGG